jgi:hypothetical protein
MTWHYVGAAAVRAAPQMDILHLINDYFGTEYEIETSWQNLFNESPQEQVCGGRLARL